MAKSIDNMTAKTKSLEINEHGAITAKQGGTDLHGWVNKHHTESSKIIDDKIKSVEGSLDERILNDLGLNEESAAWFSNAVKNEKIQPSEWTGKLICASGDGKHLKECELKYINQELKKGNHVDLNQIKSLREQASQLADDYATKIRSDEKWTQLTKEHAASKQPSTILGHELENAGIPRPPRYEAHHITPYNQGRLRKYIEKYGIDGNSTANGVFLPQNYSTNWSGQVTHSVWNNLDEKGNMMFRHGQEYIDYLEKKLKEIDKLDVRILSKADKKQEILSFLEETREGLLTGKIQFLYKD